MSLLLNIDTDAEIAIISLSTNDKILISKTNIYQKEHASFVHLAIKELLEAVGRSIRDINAISVTGGPGSYTGIRVGMATAKGLCFVLNIPLLIINSLDLLAHAACNETKQKSIFIPVIDARRMEVYTAIYDHKLALLQPPHPLILSNESFFKYLEIGNVVFAGSGTSKLQLLIKNDRATFLDHFDKASAMAQIATIRFNEGMFDDPTFADPFYLKDLFVP